MALSVSCRHQQQNRLLSRQLRLLQSTMTGDIHITYKLSFFGGFFIFVCDDVTSCVNLSVDVPSSPLPASLWMGSIFLSAVSTTSTTSSTLLLGTSWSTGDDSLSPSLSSFSSSSFIFNLLTFNARSLVNKLAYLKCLLHNESPDFVFVSETWLHSNLPDNLLCSSDYNLFIYLFIY